MITSRAEPGCRRRTFALAAMLATALLAGACGQESGPAAGADPAASASSTAQTLAVKDMWVKTAESGMTATFGTLMNPTGAEVTVVTATSTASPVMELHEVATVDGKMAMRPKPGGFVIPAGGRHELKPGGDHLMLMDVTTPVTAGTEVTITLTFADGATMNFTAVGKDFAGGNESYQPQTPGMTMGG